MRAISRSIPVTRRAHGRRAAMGVAVWLGMSLSVVVAPGASDAQDPAPEQAAPPIRPLPERTPSRASESARPAAAAEDGATPSAPSRPEPATKPGAQAARTSAGSPAAAATADTRANPAEGGRAKGPSTAPAEPETGVPEPTNIDPVRGPPQLPYAEDESLGVTFLKTILALAGVLVLTYLVLNVGLRRLMGAQAPGKARPGGLVSVVERVPLEPKKSLYVLQVAGKYVLVGSGENGLTLMRELEAADVERTLAEKPSSTPPGQLIQKLLIRGKKEP